MTPEIPGPAEGSALTAFRCGLLHATGAFDLADLSGEERAGVAEQKSWFWLGEAVMSAFLAGIIAVPAGCWFATRTELPLAVIGAAVLFLPLFIFLPKLIRQAMQIDTAAAIDAFGKNEHLRKVFWTLFLALAGLVLARIVDPVTAQNVLGMLAGL
jgi:hypothetical protein